MAPVTQTLQEDSELQRTTVTAPAAASEELR
jgi:hypothetical protein